MQRALLWTALVVAAIGTSAGADGSKSAALFCRVVGEDGKPAPEKDVGAAANVVAKRFKAAGWNDVHVAATPSPAQLRVECPPLEPAVVAEKTKEAWALLERRGVVEFRVWVDRLEEQTERKRRADQGAAYVCDVGLAWIPRVEGGPDMLVSIPEGAARARMDELRRTGTGETAPAFVEARASFDQIVRERVFTGADLARAELQTQRLVGHVIAYEFKSDRKAAFDAYTATLYAGPRPQLGTWVMIVDGKACSAALANLTKPGLMIIEGSGPTGFTESEALAIAAMIQSGPFAGRLVREYEETK